jgi:hypothetical protein
LKNFYFSWGICWLAFKSICLWSDLLHFQRRCLHLCEVGVKRWGISLNFAFLSRISGRAFWSVQFTIILQPVIKLHTCLSSLDACRYRFGSVFVIFYWSFWYILTCGFGILLFRFIMLEDWVIFHRFPWVLRFFFSRSFSAIKDPICALYSFPKFFSWCSCRQKESVQLIHSLRNSVDCGLS